MIAPINFLTPIDGDESHFMRTAQAGALRGDHSYSLNDGIPKTPAPDTPMAIDVANAIAAGMKH